MKSITIHKIEPQMHELLRHRANADGTSLNQTVKRLLEEALGIKPTPEPKHLEDFREFLGCWSEEDLATFEQATRDLRQLDEAEWR